MSEESPPTYTTSIFNQANFGSAAEGLDTAYLNSHYLRYPTAQTGTETIPNLATTNDATINGLTVGKGSGDVSTNTAFGVSALLVSNTSSSSYDNTAIGYLALTANTNGINNTAVGSNALSANTTGSYNTALGVAALDSVEGGLLNTAIGYRALFKSTASYNTAVGSQALLNTTSGGYNTAVGSNALDSNTTGIENTAVGSSCLYSAVSVSQNTAVGHEALYATTSGTQTAVGFHAARNATGINNLAIGYQALKGSAGTNTGVNNTAIGSGALVLITSGVSNTAVGYTSLNALTTGEYNTALGADTLLSNTTGTANVAVGFQAGFAGTANTTGSFNTYLGFQSQTNGNNYSNSTALGSGAIITASNQVVLGTTSEKVIIPNQIQHSYSSLPTFTSTSIGYTNNFDLASLGSGTGTRDSATTSIALPIGVYMCHLFYQIDITFPTTTRSIIDFRVSSGATLVNEARMGFVYAPAMQEYNYLSIPAILVVSTNPCVVFTRLTSDGGNGNINIAELAVVRIA